MIGFESLEQRQMLAVDLLAGLRNTEPRSTRISKFERMDDGSILLFSEEVGVWQIETDGSPKQLTTERFGPRAREVSSRGDLTVRLGNRLLYRNQVFDIDSANSYELPVTLPQAGGATLEGTAYFTDSNGEIAYFVPSWPRNEDNAVWQTDGTVEGTKQVASLEPNSLSSILGVVPGAIVYRSFPQGSTLDSVNRLDISTGEVTTVYQTTGKIFNRFGRVGDLIAFQVQFASQPSLLVFTDGTAQGTQEIQVQQQEQLQSRVIGDLLFYWDTVDGEQKLHVSNGSPFATGSADTILGIPSDTSLHRIQPVRDGFVYVSGPRPRETVGFVGYNGEHRVLGSFDRTTEMTDNRSMVAARKTAARGNTIYTHSFGDQVIVDRPGLVFVTDGTVEGSKFFDTRNLGLTSEPVGPLGDSIVVANQRATADGREPWISDGTEGGTRLLADLNPGVQPIHETVANVTAVGDSVFFATLVQSKRRSC